MEVLLSLFHLYNFISELNNIFGTIILPYIGEHFDCTILLFRK